MAANKEEDFSFKAPDWENEEAYSHLGEDTSNDEWAWEFRRRNEEYWKDSKYCYEYKKFILENNITEELLEIAKDECEKEEMRMAREDLAGGKMTREPSGNYRMVLPSVDELKRKYNYQPSIKEFSKVLNKPELSSKETRALLEKIYDDWRGASYCCYKWQVEEKAPDPAYTNKFLKVIPNPNSPFSEVKINQSMGEDRYFPKPKIVRDSPGKENENKAGIPPIKIEVSPLRSVKSNLAEIKNLLEQECKKLKKVKDFYSKGNRVQKSLYRNYLRLFDGEKKGASHTELCKLFERDTHGGKEQMKSKVRDSLKAAKKLVEDIPENF